MASRFKKGDFAELDGVPCVVVGVYGDEDVPEDHIAVWFGDPVVISKSKGGKGNVIPEVWTVPEEYFEPGQPPNIRH